MSAKLIFMPMVGASVHILQKFLFECSAMGKGNVHKFHKPMFFTWLGSFGLFLVSILNLGKRIVISFRCVLAIGLATLLNLTTGVLANWSSLYLNYSISLMLRSSTLIFGAMISVFYLKRGIWNYQLIGVVLTVVSMVLIGASAMLSKSKTTHVEVSSGTVLFHVVLRIASKSLQAIAILIEEKVMSASNITAFEMTGLAGWWSFVLSAVFVLPMEDLTDTIAMLRNSREIVSYSIVIVVAFAVWTLLSHQITNKVSALARMVFDQLSIVFVWVVQLSIRWWVVGTNLEEKYGKVGEEWTKWSWLQLLGFLLMIYGACIYQKFISIPVKPYLYMPLVNDIGLEV